MYIKYKSTQFRIEHIWGHITGPHPSPPNTLDHPLPKPSTMPSKLVRVRPWGVVDGKDVDEGYCALSYSWNWSGDMVSDNDKKTFTRDDKHLHKITAYYQDCEPKMKITRYVSFENAIQQVCLDFNIRYIWFDQLCIDQHDIKQQQEEIKQMHSVYQLAHCTVVLIPELRAFNDKKRMVPKVTSNIFDINKNSEWCKRAWTLEEAYMSRKLLFIGSNVHMWSKAAENVRPGLGYDDHFFYNVCTKPEERNASTALWNASTVLWHARYRISSKEHDRVFALANMLPKIRNRIKFDYNQRILNLMRDFYSLVAETDLSILCFGAPLDAEVTRLKKEVFSDPTDSDSLPSWSGINGLHLPQLDPEDLHLQAAANVEYNLLNGLFLNLKSSCTTIFLKCANNPRVSESSRNNGYMSGEERFQNTPVVEKHQAAYGFFPEASTRTTQLNATSDSPCISNVTFSTPIVSEPQSTVFRFLSTRRTSPDEPIRKDELIRNKSYPSHNSRGLAQIYPMFPPEQIYEPTKVLDDESEHHWYPETLPESDHSHFSMPTPASTPKLASMPTLMPTIMPTVMPPMIPTTMPTMMPDPMQIQMPKPAIYSTVYSSLSFVPADGPAFHYETFMRTYGLKVTHWLPIKNIGDAWTPTKTSEAQCSGGYLSLIDDDCGQCLILSGVGFRISSERVTAFPVVKFYGIYYKSIGLCFLTDSIKLDYGVNTVNDISIY